MNIHMMLREYQARALESVKHDRELQIYLVLLVVLVVGGGGYYGYRWYSAQRSQKAQQAFAASLDIYQQAMAMQFEPHAKSQDRASLWEQVVVDAHHALQQYGRSLYTPFFKSFLAQAQYYQNRHADALVTLRDAVRTMPVQYRGLYRVMLDLMLLDGNSEEQKQACADLEVLATDIKSRVQDMALYYLGLYFAGTGDQKRAMGYFKQAGSLLQPYPELSAAQSPWKQLALQKLAELGVDEHP